MSDTDPTPETPVTIGDRLGWWRGEQQTYHAELMTALAGLDARLLALETAVSALGDTPAALADMRGTAPGNTLHEIYALLSAVNAAVGGAPSSSLELVTVRGLLYALLQAGAVSGIPLADPATGDATNDGELALSGRRYAVWGILTHTTTSANGVYLTPDVSWDGWQIYIQTDSPTATMHDLDNSGASIVDAYPVNSWVDLAGGDTLAWSVPASYHIRATLRPPDTFPIDYPIQMCLNANSSVVTITNFGFTRNIAVFSSEFSPTSATGASGSPNYATFSAACFATGNYNGGTIKAVTGQARLVYYQLDYDLVVINLVTGYTYTFPEDTIGFYVDDVGFGSSFTVRVCPPGLV